MKKYKNSFEVDPDEIPTECPICNHELNLQEDVDTNYHKNGIISMLCCPKCNFKKTISFTTDEDAEMQYVESLNDVDADSEEEYEE